MISRGDVVTDRETREDGKIVSVTGPMPFLYGVELPGRGVVYRYQVQLTKHHGAVATREEG